MPTNKYTIEINGDKTNAAFVVSYKDGSFQRMEKKRFAKYGNWKDLMTLIPLKESELSFVKERFKSILSIYKQASGKSKSLFSKFMDTYITFYEKTGISPKITGADGAALKQIISYLKGISADEEEAFATWQLILGKWNQLDEFYKKQKDIKQINSNLNTILRNLMDNGTTENKREAKRHADDLRESL